jgi:predicted metal-dependent hydrolase
MQLKITDEAQVVVSVPSRTASTRIRKFVEDHIGWIEEKLEFVDKLPKRLPIHTFQTGDVFLFLGEQLKLELSHKQVKRTTCTREGSTLMVSAPANAKEMAVKRAIEMWYRKEGTALYERLVSAWIAELGFHASVLVDIAPFPKRWGSCSHSGELRFALRSLVLPLELVDYLALHETAHLLHFNHGVEFKRLLERHMPSWRERQKRLSELRIRASSL